MAYVKKYTTKEELSVAMASAGRKGALARIKAGHNNGGRKPALKCDKDPVSTCTIRESDQRYISRMSFSLGIAKAACIRVLVLQYRALHPELLVGEETKTKLDESMAELGKFVKTMT